ncbi:YicC/YloC family endoribonuclease [Crenobacter cavernae]|uniref:YicC family protein n=1 Tax=Crenobacter cavernae TaxID=2290923 RepID=A0ABY0FEU8_9NEIS|nr:YicC/YloC family endoribonuclease [Crenobacter cavernae]RXZ44827.1 YicC family protein [Crenobacter cavernae]
MISSMTGFSVATRDLPGAVLNLELRAVNHRYLDLQMRLPEELRPIESQLRELISAKVTRGKVECRIGFNASESDAPSLELNRELLNRVLALGDELAGLRAGLAPLTTAELLRWPGVLKSNEVAAEVLQKAALETLGKLLDDFNASRVREGEKLKAILIEKLDGIEAIVTAVKPRLPQILEAYLAKLSARLAEALDNVDDDRIKQEFALFAQKIDVDEELGRLSTHVSEVRRILKAGGQAGKRLDFLMQELNREANTLGSKSVSPETTQASVELKVLIEQMREQIQNLE